MLRDGILDSERVNRLDDEEEVFFRRLMSIVDDYGRFEANRAKLRARLYPLKLDNKSEQRIGDLLLATVRERLVFVYRVGPKVFLQVLNFCQQTRSKSKCPPPDDKQLKAFTQQLPTPDQQRQCLADAQQLITNAHLGVFVFGDVVVGGDVVVVGPDRARAASPTTTTTTASRKERKPKNVAAVIAHAASVNLNLSEAEAAKFFAYNKARGWKLRGELVEDWRELLVLWQCRGEEGAAKNSSGGAGAGGAAPDFDSTRPNAHTGGLQIVT
jgi:hypothetical protein